MLRWLGYFLKREEIEVVILAKKMYVEGRGKTEKKVMRWNIVVG